jgi:hypothetical protein
MKPNYFSTLSFFSLVNTWKGLNLSTEYLLSAQIYGVEYNSSFFGGCQINLRALNISNL